MFFELNKNSSVNECLENSVNFSTICIEILDFLSLFKKENELKVRRGVLLVLYKISSLVKKEIVFSYPLLISKLMNCLDEMKGRFC